MSLHCKKCKKKFGTFQNLEKHTKKKIPCDRVLKCDKCEKIFTHKGNLNKHVSRKTSCEPIQGDPTQTTPESSCHFCYKKFKWKYGLKNHYGICKIKNGGMSLLFKKVELLEQENKIIKTQLSSSGNIIINGSKNNVHKTENHNTAIFNFTIVNFGDGQDTMVDILSREAPKILEAERQFDSPLIKQIQDRIVGLIMKIHRNPSRKELQNVYVTDPQQKDNNSFIYEEGKWTITDWDKLNKKILSNLYNNLVSAKIKSKQDKLKVMKHIFVESGCGDSETVDKMSDGDVADMYLKIGKKLEFATISL